MRHDGMDFPLRLAQGFQVTSDLLTDVLAANCCEPAALGVDHPPELVAASIKLSQLFAHCILWDCDVIGLAAPHLIGRGSIGGQQASI